MTIVGSVDAGGTEEVPDSEGSMMVIPEEFHFVPLNTIRCIVQELGDEIKESFVFACHFRVKVFPSTYLEEVVGDFEHVWGESETISMTSPDYQRLRQPAVFSVRAFEIGIFLAGLLGIGLIGKNGDLIQTIPSVWCASIFLIAFLFAYSLLAPSLFIPSIMTVDVTWIVSVASLITLCIAAVYFDLRKRSCGGHRQGVLCGSRS